MENCSARATPAPEAEQPVEPASIPGVIGILGELGAGAVITEGGLAKLFGRHPASIKRAIQRGELPPPCRMFGQNTWTAGTLVRHIETRLAEAAKEARRVAERVVQLSP